MCHAGWRVQSYSSTNLGPRHFWESRLLISFHATQSGLPTSVPSVVLCLLCLQFYPLLWCLPVSLFSSFAPSIDGCPFFLFLLLYDVFRYLVSNTVLSVIKTKFYCLILPFRTPQATEWEPPSQINRLRDRFACLKLAMIYKRKAYKMKVQGPLSFSF